jgi:AmmeMemoRadiSam system protein A
MAAAPDAVLSWPGYARRVIECAARGSDPMLAGAPPAHDGAHGGVFVTLHKSGRLRGCMGSLDPSTPLGDAVRQASVCAAVQDPRFPPVTPGELQEIRIEISILSAPQPMRDLTDLHLGRHGILVRRGAQRGLFLPQVAVEHRLDKHAFLSRCCAEKAGLPATAWHDPGTEVLLFTTEVLREVQ